MNASYIYLFIYFLGLILELYKSLKNRATSYLSLIFFFAIDKYTFIYF